jgi:hypothetical protein
MTLQFTARKAFAALIVSFLFHNIEEAVSICSYPVQNPVSFIKPASCHQFLWAVSIISLIVIAFFIVAIRTKNSTFYLLISTSIASGLVLNVLIPHIFIAVYTLKYTPGLLTAVLLNLPLGLITLFKNRSVFSNRKQFYRFIGIGLVIGYLIFVVVMSFVKQIIQ